MELRETSEGRIKAEFENDHTVANLVRKGLWESGSEAGYDSGHPLGDESTLIVDSSSPEEDLEEAVDTCIGWIEELQEQAEDL